MPQGPTIRDIADKLGLGKSTVQRALASNGSISSQSRQMVMEAAKQLGYRPDPLFSILGSQSRKSRVTPLRIAYVSRHDNPDPARRPQAGVDVFQAAKARGLTLGYNVEQVGQDEFSGGKRLMDVLYHRGFVGVLLGPVRSPDRETILSNTHLPIVCCGRIDPLPLHTVQPDIAQMVRLAWRKMFEAGYRRIGAAIGIHSPPIEDDADRFGTVLQCQEETVGKNERVPPLRTALNDTAAFLDWFQRHKLEAVLGFHNGLYYTLKDSGAAISRIGFASLHASAGDPFLAGIVEPLDSILREALNLLDQLIRHRSVGIPEEPLHILLPGTWKDGDSLPSILRKA